MQRRRGHVSDDLDMMAQILNIKKTDCCDHDAEAKKAAKELEQQQREEVDAIIQAVTSESDDEENKEDFDILSDNDLDVGYRNASYWALPENVRHAIDLSKRKSKNTDFCNHLTVLNGKIDLYKQLFYARLPKHEEHFQEKQRIRKLELEEAMNIELKRLMNVEHEKLSPFHHANIHHGSSKRNLHTHGSAEKSNSTLGENEAMKSYERMDKKGGKKDRHSIS